MIGRVIHTHADKVKTLDNLGDFKAAKNKYIPKATNKL